MHGLAKQSAIVVKAALPAQNMNAQGRIVSLFPYPADIFCFETVRGLVTSQMRLDHGLIPPKIDDGMRWKQWKGSTRETLYKSAIHWLKIGQKGAKWRLSLVEI